VLDHPPLGEAALDGVGQRLAGALVDDVEDARQGLAAGLVYVISQSAGVPYDERAIGVVNFSDLSPKAKKAALKAANEARCSCGCRLGLAECVSTDKTCPIRESNIDKIRGMVRDAGEL